MIMGERVSRKEQLISPLNLPVEKIPAFKQDRRLPPLYIQVPLLSMFVLSLVPICFC